MSNQQPEDRNYAGYELIPNMPPILAAEELEQLANDVYLHVDNDPDFYAKTILPCVQSVAKSHKRDETRISPTLFYPEIAKQIKDLGYLKKLDGNDYDTVIVNVSEIMAKYYNDEIELGNY